MPFFKPSLGTFVPPALLVVFALPEWPVLRLTVYSVLAVPIQPLIRSLGWVYPDKPMFLTYPAAVLTAGAWAVALYLALCYVRYRRSYATSAENRVNDG